MTWFILARTLFVAAIAFTAWLLEPLAALGDCGVTGSAVVVNVVFGVALAVLIILFELRLKDVAVTTTLGALLGGVIGLAIAKTIEAALAWTDDTRRPRRVPPQRRAARAALHRDRDGRAQGRVARAGAPGRPVPRGRPAAALQGARHERHHRRPDRRHLRDRLHRRRAGHPAVRAQGTAARRRLRRRAEAEPRAPRASTSCRRSRRCRASRWSSPTSTSPRSARWTSSSSSSRARCRGRSSPTTST